MHRAIGPPARFTQSPSVLCADLLEEMHVGDVSSPKTIPALQISVPTLVYRALARRALPLSLDMEVRTRVSGETVPVIVLQQHALQHRVIVPIVDADAMQWLLFCTTQGFVTLSVNPLTRAAPRLQTVLHAPPPPNNSFSLMTKPEWTTILARARAQQWADEIRHEAPISTFTGKALFSCTDYVYAPQLGASSR